MKLGQFRCSTWEGSSLARKYPTRVKWTTKKNTLAFFAIVLIARVNV